MNFKQSEEAFRIYTDIYAIANPDRDNQLLQYVDTINTAANTYIWENVAHYDDIFRHLNERYPKRLFYLIMLG